MQDLTLKEVCAQLKIGRQTFYKMDRDGCFPNQYRLGTTWMRRFPQSDLDTLIANAKIVAKNAAKTIGLIALLLFATVPYLFI